MPVVRDYATVTEASDVTTEILEAAVEIYRGWPDAPWGERLDRLDGMELADGRLLDLGGSLVSAAVRRIKQYVSAHAGSEG